MKDKEFKLLIMTGIILIIIILPAIAMVISEKRLHRTVYSCESDFDCGLTQKARNTCCEECGFQEIVNIDETRDRNQWRDENCADIECADVECPDYSEFDDIRCLRGRCTGIRKESALDQDRQLAIYDNPVTGAAIMDRNMDSESRFILSDWFSDARFAFSSLFESGHIRIGSDSHLGYRAVQNGLEMSRVDLQMFGLASSATVGKFRSDPKNRNYELDLLNIKFSRPISTFLGRIQSFSIGQKIDFKPNSITSLPIILPFIRADID